MPSASGRPAISARNVTFSYGGPPVLEDATFDVEQGDFASIVGPNGGGKTTLLKLILGLLHPGRGELLVNGLPPTEARPSIGYMPQQANLDPKFPISILDIVLMGRLAPGMSPRPFHGRADREEAMEALRSLGLEELRNHSLSELSGGQRQRVLIARALACNPDILLLDEPTAHLDLHLEDEFLEILKDLNRRMTVVMVSHDLGFVSSCVNRCICVNRHVHLHPTSTLHDDLIKSMYGDKVRLIRHDVNVPEDGGP
jgi:zinc transport system ATP-binding protein